MKKVTLFNIIFGIVSLLTLHTSDAMKKKNPPKLKLVINPVQLNEVNPPSPTLKKQHKDQNAKESATNNDQSAQKPKKKAKKKKKKAGSTTEQKDNAGKLESVVSQGQPQKSKQLQAEPQKSVELKKSTESKEKKEKVENDFLRIIFKLHDAQADEAQQKQREHDHLDLLCRLNSLAVHLDTFGNQIDKIDRSYHRAIEFKFSYLIIRKFAMAIVESLLHYGINDASTFIKVIIGEHIHDSYEQLKKIGQVSFGKELNFNRPQIALMFVRACAALEYSSVETLLNALYQDVSKIKSSHEFIQDSMRVFSAIITKNKDTINHLKQKYVLDFFNQPDWLGVPPLLYAAYFDNVDMIAFLIDNGIGIDVADKEGRTALMIAASEGNTKSIKLLMGCKADVGACDKNGYCAADYAYSARESYRGNPLFSQILLLLGAPQTKIAYKKPPQKFKFDLFEGIDTIRPDYSLRKDIFEYSRLMLLAIKELEKLHKSKNVPEIRMQVARIELRKFASLIARYFKNVEKRNPQSFIDIYLKDYVNKSFTIDYVEETMKTYKLIDGFCFATLFEKARQVLGLETMLDLINLLYKDCDSIVNSEKAMDQHEYHLAIIARNIVAQKMVLDQNKSIFEPDWLGTSPLLYAAYNNCNQSVKFMAKHAPNFAMLCSQWDNQGRLPLLCTSDPQIEAILKPKTDINYHDKQGNTALMTAMRAGNLPVVKALISHGADVNAQNVQGKIPLLDADEMVATCGHLGNCPQKEIAKELLARGADVNIRNAAKQPPLYTAICSQAVSVVSDLLGRGADVTMKFGGKTMLEWAIEKAKEKPSQNAHVIVTLIEERLAKKADAQKEAKRAQEKKARHEHASAALAKVVDKSNYLKRKTSCAPVFAHWKTFTLEKRKLALQERKKEREAIHAKIKSFRKEHLLKNQFRTWKNNVQIIHAQEKMADMFKSEQLPKRTLKNAFIQWKSAYQGEKKKQQELDSKAQQFRNAKDKIVKRKALLDLRAFLAAARARNAELEWAEKAKQMEADSIKFAEQEAQKAAQYTKRKQMEQEQLAERKKKMEEEAAYYKAHLDKAEAVYKEHIENQFLNEYRQKNIAIDNSFTTKEQSNINALHWQQLHTQAVKNQFDQKHEIICPVCMRHCHIKGDGTFEWPEYFELLKKNK